MTYSWKWAIAVPTLVLFFATGLTARAEHAAKGTLKSVSGTEMVVTDDQGKDWTYRLADNPFIVCPESKDAKLSDLKPGAMVSVLWDKKGTGYEANAILHHEGAYRDAGLAHGKIKTVADDNSKVVISDDKGKDWTYTMSDGANIRFKRQGAKEGAKLSSFKSGDPVMFAYNRLGDRYTLLSICDCAK